VITIHTTCFHSKDCKILLSERVCELHMIFGLNCDLNNANKQVSVTWRMNLEIVLGKFKV
jgi:hypothetical protein